MSGTLIMSSGAGPPALQHQAGHHPAGAADVNSHHENLDHFDALAAEDFDPIAFLNKQFPSEKSLQHVDKVMQQLDKIAATIDTELRHAVHEQARTGFRAKEDLEQAKTAMGDLITRVKNVQSKAQQSESLVLEFCRNIKFLDLAKKNLTNTVTGFKRFVMLVSALEQLRRLAAEREYKKAAQLLHACEELAQHFQGLSKVVQKVHDLLRQKDSLLADLRAQIFEDYDALLDPTDVDLRREDIKAAAHCVNAMPTKTVRHEIVTRFCLRILEDYKKIFSPSQSQTALGVGAPGQPGGAGGPGGQASQQEEYSGLEHVERRYAWLRRTLKEFDDKYLEFFPSFWGVPCSLCEHFCHITRQHLVEVLGATHHTADPELLVRVLRKSIEFENDLAKKFAASADKDGNNRERQLQARSPGGEKPVRHISEFVTESDPGADADRADPSRELPMAFVKYGFSPTKRAQQASPEDSSHLPRFRGIVSECFEAYLGTWVNYEASNLKALIPEQEDMPQVETGTTGPASAEEDDDLGDDDSRYVFPSAPALFDAMRRVMMKCVSFSIDQTLFEIFLVFKQTANLYCSTIHNRVKRMTVGSGYVISDEDLKIACACIGTLEYVDQMLPQLSDIVRQHLTSGTSTSSQYQNKIDFDSEQETLGAITASIYADVLVNYPRMSTLLARLSATMMSHYAQKFSKRGAGGATAQGGSGGDITTALGQHQQPPSAVASSSAASSSAAAANSSSSSGSASTSAPTVSPFVAEIEDIFTSHCSLTSGYLSKLHYRFFCDKHAQWFIPRFTHEIYKCRGVSKQVARQFLMDAVAIKNVLLQVPAGALRARSGGASSQISMPTAYSNFVLREFGRVEFIFKVLSEEEEAVHRLNHGVDVTQKEIDQILMLKEGAAMDDEMFNPVDGGDLLGGGSVDPAARNNPFNFVQSTLPNVNPSMKQFASDARKQADTMKQLAADARKKLFGNIKF
ncbi:unnamed protein product [Amoebophrya sp. A120]|nr:unnamed protein product [Amoebophrya sp. A120]|eukprot:GSA120T00002230001.1